MELLGEARGEQPRRQGDHAEPDDRAHAADHFAERRYRHHLTRSQTLARATPQR